MLIKEERNIYKELWDELLNYVDGKNNCENIDEIMRIMYNGKVIKILKEYTNNK